MLQTMIDVNTVNELHGLDKVDKVDKIKRAKRTKRQRNALRDKSFNAFFEHKIHSNFSSHSKVGTFNDCDKNMFGNKDIFYGDRVYPTESILSTIKNKTVKKACSLFNWDVSTTLSILPALILRNKIKIDFSKGNFVRFVPPSNVPHVSEFLSVLGAVDNGGDSFYSTTSFLRYYGFLRKYSKDLKGTLIEKIFLDSGLDIKKKIINKVILTKVAPDLVKNQVKKVVEEHCGRGFFKEQAYDDALEFHLIPDTIVLKVPKGYFGERKIDNTRFGEFLESNNIYISSSNRDIIQNRLYRCLARKCCISIKESSIYVPPLYLSGYFGISKNVLFDLSEYDILKNEVKNCKIRRVSPPDWVKKDIFEYDPYPIDKDRTSMDAELYRWSYMADQKWDNSAAKKILDKHFSEQKITHGAMKKKKSLKVVNAHLLNADMLIKAGLEPNNAEYMTLCTEAFHPILDRHKSLGDKLRFLMSQNMIDKRQAKNRAKRAIGRLKEETSESADILAKEVSEDCKDILAYRIGHKG